MERFTPLLLTGCSAQEKLLRLRLNSLGSLYYFTHVVLGRKRLTEKLHAPICASLERKHIKDVYELPRDHFKSTICSESLPMWWALPFTAKEQDQFLKLGYSDEYIKHMRSVHNPMHRTLLISENITNAAKLGKRIRYHFESNAIFRAAFYDILPTAAESWTSFSLSVNRAAFGGASHGEGNFDFIGVGGALQSRHYDAIIQDDIVGRKAVGSQSVMDDTIQYHKILPGAFDSTDPDYGNDELVVGNRWGFHDLNSYLREHEPEFSFHSHSALGGCCDMHPADTPIFPEAFSFEKLMGLKRRYGNYEFSCQYLNNPISPEDADFRSSDLCYFTFVRGEGGRVFIQHEVKDGIVRKDVALGHLQISMAVDPTHSGNTGAGRCRHAIVVLGKFSDPAGGDRYYLLQSWAKACSLETFVGEIYKIAERWHIRKFGVETSAGQVYLKFHLDQKNLVANNKIDIIPLKGEVEAPDGTITTKKEWRIRNVLSPLFEQQSFYVQRNQQDFIGEFTTFPRGKYCDQLDALAYIPQMLRGSMSLALHNVLLQKNQARARKVNQPYSYSGANVLHVN